MSVVVFLVIQIIIMRVTRMSEAQARAELVRFRNIFNRPQVAITLNKNELLPQMNPIHSIWMGI